MCDGAAAVGEAGVGIGQHLHSVPRFLDDSVGQGDLLTVACSARFNLRRLMARSGLMLAQVVRATSVCERTIKDMLSRSTKPHAHAYQDCGWTWCFGE